jgi:hypothetical protein
VELGRVMDVAAAIVYEQSCSACVCVTRNTIVV